MANNPCQSPFTCPHGYAMAGRPKSQIDSRGCILPMISMYPYKIMGVGSEEKYPVETNRKATTRLQLVT